MDVLFAAANVGGVVSLAVQLGDSIKKLCDFWDSVKEACPRNHHRFEPPIERAYCLKSNTVDQTTR